MTIDLSLSNNALWSGCKIEPAAGKLTLITLPEEAIATLTRSLAGLEIDPDEITLTGSMAIWAYLVAFHFLHGRTRRIYYQDGRGQRLLVAAHG
jgi:hypothetical protein